MYDTVVSTSTYASIVVERDETETHRRTDGELVAAIASYDPPSNDQIERWSGGHLFPYVLAYLLALFPVHTGSLQKLLFESVSLPLRLVHAFSLCRTRTTGLTVSEVISAIEYAAGPAGDLVRSLLQPPEWKGATPLQRAAIIFRLIIECRRGGPIPRCELRFETRVDAVATTRQKREGKPGRPAMVVAKALKAATLSAAFEIVRAATLQKPLAAITAAIDAPDRKRLLNALHSRFDPAFAVIRIAAALGIEDNQPTVESLSASDDERARVALALLGHDSIHWADAGPRTRAAMLARRWGART